MSSSKTPILLLGLLSAFSLITFDLYQPSLSHITKVFGTTHSLSQLTLIIYLLVFGITQLFWGPLVDHFGRRRMLPGSLVLAIVATLICVFSKTITMLIIGRGLQGFALCCANLIAFSSARDFEDSLERARVLSYISMIVSTSPIIAPVLGAVIFTYLGWRANFMLMALFAVVLLVYAQFSLKESPFWKTPVDTFSLRKVAQSYLSILPSPTLWCGSIIIALTFSAVMFTIINSSYIIITQLGYSPLAFGVIFIFNGLNMIAGNYLGIWLRDRFSMTSTIYLGVVLIIISGAVMLLTSAHFGFSLATLSLALIANLGISVSSPPTMALLLTDFKDNSAVASAFVNTMRMLLSAVLSYFVGIYIVGNILVLPISLLACGLVGLVFARLFVRLVSEDEDEESQAPLPA